MIRVLFIDQYGNTVDKSLDFRPMVGDQVEWKHYKPNPTISNIAIKSNEIHTEFPPGIDILATVE
jgi:hypothetical protein